MVMIPELVARTETKVEARVVIKVVAKARGVTDIITAAKGIIIESKVEQLSIMDVNVMYVMRVCRHDGHHDSYDHDHIVNKRTCIAKFI